MGYPWERSHVQNTLKSRDRRKMAAPVEVVREDDEQVGTADEVARMTKGEDDVVMNKLAEGIFGLLGPAVNEIDDRVADVR